MSNADRTLDEHPPARRRSESGSASSSAAGDASADANAVVRAPDVPALDASFGGSGVGGGAHDPAGGDRVLGKGERCGEYVVDGLIGEGAFGSVYRGVHLLIGKPAAIKVLSLRHSVDPAIVARFVDEARAVNKIHHDGIIDIFGFGRLDDGRQYYVMELLAGRTLQEHLVEQGALAPNDALAILGPVAAALEAAHEKGIAHRDVKPANIFLVDVPARVDGGARKIKLLDFGIAKLGTNGKSDPTGTQPPRTDAGAVVGTPAYMSPEQCLAKPIDHRADIYALGVVAFEVLTGQRPFRRSTSFELMHDHVHVPLPAATSLQPSLPNAVDDALRTIAAKDPAERPASIQAAFHLLERALAGQATKTKTATTKTKAVTTEPARPKTSTSLAAAQSSKLALLLAGGALLVAGIAVGVVVKQSHDRPPPPPWERGPPPDERGPPPDERGPPPTQGQAASEERTTTTPPVTTTTASGDVSFDVRGVPPDGLVLEGDRVLRQGNGPVLLSPGVHTLTLRGEGLIDHVATIDTARDRWLHVGRLRRADGGGPPPHDGPPRDGEGPPRDGPPRDGPPRDGPPRDGPPRDGPPPDGPPGARP